MNRGKNLILLLSGVFIGGLLTSPAVHAASNLLTAAPSAQTFYVGNEKVELEAYVINGNNYVKLRDVGQVVDFGVTYDGTTNSVHIQPREPYQPEEKGKGAGTVALPADGSRYVPQVGDTLLCDDGTTYTITDVSRWDANAFGSGPLGELPAPTCDWRLLDQPKMPEPEVRHYEVQGKDYCMVRNLYETRRMLYTLYNAVGANPDTWKDDGPVLRADGSQMVRFELTIPKEENPNSMWPWKEDNLVSLFNSCPPGTYHLEAWDVYKDGVFQRTEYNIKVK